jgi:hypothetical protein
LTGVGHKASFVSEIALTWFRKREHEYQFLGLVQDEAKLAPNNLWMSRSGYDSVSPI